jgi:hypothetical protein
MKSNVETTYIVIKHVFDWSMYCIFVDAHLCHTTQELSLFYGNKIVCTSP